MALKIFFCIDDAGIDGELGQWLLVAVRGVVANTSLHPVVAYCGESAERVEQYASAGAEILMIRSRLLPAIQAGVLRGEFPPWTEGAMLRYELPSRFPDDEWIVYADCDVYFRRDPEFPLADIDIVGAARATMDDSSTNHNSGVLVFNTGRFREPEAEFFAFMEETLGRWLPASVDQEAFNAFFGDRISTIDHELNWRTNFGFNEAAVGLHFHSVRFLRAEWLLTGDFRGFERALLTSGYLHEYVRHIASSVHEAMRYLPEIVAKGHLADTTLGEQVDRVAAKLAEGELLENALVGRAETVMVAVEALKLTYSTPVRTKGRRLSLAYDADVPEAKMLMVHLCRHFGYGVLHVRFPGPTAEGVQLIHSPAIILDQAHTGSWAIQGHWAAAGLDCHVVLTRPDATIGTESLTLEIRGFGHLSLKLFAMVEGSGWVPVPTRAAAALE